MATGEAAGTAADYQAAITRYQDFLKTYPNDPGNDRVLYQLARAHELGGELETALKTLDQLVLAYPRTAYRDEAQFRRGELLFALRDYPEGAGRLRGDDAGRSRLAVPRALAVHAGLVAVQAGPARGVAAVVLRRARPEAGRPRQRRASSRSCRG